jgi:hypothetical protein
MDSKPSDNTKVRRQLLEQIDGAKAHTRHVPVFSLPVAVQFDKHFITGQLQILQHEGRVDLKIDPSGQAGMVKLTPLGLKSLETPEVLPPAASDQIQHSPPRLLDRQRAMELLKRQKDVDLDGFSLDHPEFIKWRNLTRRIVEEAFGQKHGNLTQFANFALRDDGHNEYIRIVRERQALLESFVEQLELFEPQVPATATLSVEREGVFFAGENSDAFLRTAKILAGAKTSISIIDGYIGPDLLSLLTDKPAGVMVSVLTKPLSPSLLTLCKAFNQQYDGLAVRSSSAFHDRFVIVDDAEFYHFGASLKDLGKRGFMFSRLEEPDVIEALRKKFHEEWSTGNVEI